VGEIIPDLKSLITGMNARDKIAQIEVSCGDNATGLVFRNLISLDESDIKALKEFAALHDLWIYLQPGGPETIFRLYPAGDSLLSYSFPEFELEFLFKPSDFIQINAQINKKMVKQAIAMLDPSSNDSVLDLFCGLGNFTLPIAQKAGFVTGVEASEDMISRAQENARHNKLNNVRFKALDIESETDETPWGEIKFNKALIDPPRSGAKNAINFLKKTLPEKIVYISCNPSTLARDAGELVHDGTYRLTLAGIMDMFPHTAHVEAMAVFETMRQKPEPELFINRV
jgi:23S rRNA (uracil1939-C5)-methyltransferase